MARLDVRLVAVTVLAGFVISAAEASSQSPLSVRVSPLLAYGHLGGVTAVPVASGSSATTPIHFDAEFVAGLAVELDWAGPLDLRAGVSRTIGANLASFSGWESCGANCQRALYSDVGSAAATTFWADVILRPVSGRLAPYALAGLARRFRTYGETDAAIASHFERTDVQTMLRYGVGLELRQSSRGSVWMELATHRTNETFGNHGPQRWPMSDTHLAAGFNVRLF